MTQELEDMLRAFGGVGTVVVTAAGDSHVVKERAMEEKRMPDEMYAHFRLDFEGGCATLCALKDGAGYKVGLSLCSPRDQFSRARGRAIARGRALADSIAFAFVPEGQDDLGGQLRREFAKYLGLAKDLPRWVRHSHFLMDVRWRIYEDTDAIMMA